MSIGLCMIITRTSWVGVPLLQIRHIFSFRFLFLAFLFLFFFIIILCIATDLEDNCISPIKELFRHKE